jgi:hypothetical protein
MKATRAPGLPWVRRESSKRRIILVHGVAAAGLLKVTEGHLGGAIEAVWIIVTGVQPPQP